MKASSATPGATAALAAFASGLQFTDIPPDVVGKARLCLMDTLGCCIYGATLPPVMMLTKVAMEEGGHAGGRAVASILGTGKRTSPSHAALVNGTAAHAFQLDEVHAGATLHPGSVVVPAILGLSEAAGGVSGQAFMTAMIAGYEVGIRVGQASKGLMFKRGYHNQGTTGAVAAGAAAARILGLDPRRTLHAIGIAASQAAGLMAVQEGANAKAFHSGRAAQSGVYAALLAKEGYTGVEDVLDVEYGGFFSTLVESYDPASLTRGLGTDWETLNVGYKLSPASNGSITAMHTLQRIMREHGLSAGDLEHVHASVSTNTLDHCGWDFDPVTMKGVLAAQMNLRYGLAVMALDGVATPAQYAQARIKSADIAAFLPRIEVDVLPAFDADAALRLACRLQVRTCDGRTHVDETRYRPGSVEDPVSSAALESKFTTLTAHAASPQRAAEWISYIKRLDAHASVALPALN